MECPSWEPHGRSACSSAMEDPQRQRRGRGRGWKKQRPGSRVRRQGGGGGGVAPGVWSRGAIAPSFARGAGHSLQALQRHGSLLTALPPYARPRGSNRSLATPSAFPLALIPVGPSTPTGSQYIRRQLRWKGRSPANQSRICGCWGSSSRCRGEAPHPRGRHVRDIHLERKMSNVMCYAFTFSAVGRKSLSSSSTTQSLVGKEDRTEIVGLATHPNPFGPIKGSCARSDSKGDLGVRC